MFNILATKLHIPKTRPNLVPRPRLTQRLLAGMDRKLTLVSAPAGSGKTTLLAEWIPQSERCVTWLSLDEGDHDPVRFWTYFIAALQRLDAEIGKQALAQLQEPALPPIETILTTLLNEIAAFPDSFALVLDDYHAIDAIDAAIDAKPVDASKSIDSALAFLLEHLPPQMHLVITTREDPALPLARLRARDQLTELRLADLRFTPGEAADFLNHVMGLDLSAEQVDALEARTEGWIAGLQLAALSMQGREDLQGFIRAFSGDDRYIVEYLVAEVLQRQPEALRSFLLQTAILERLCGPLCEAVTGQAGGGERLQALERGNFFVVPLDDQRYWYRYHHLFAEVLSVHLKAKEPEQVSALHRRASKWYAQNGQPAEAVRHALAAGDFERAADQIEGALQAMRRSKQVTLLLGWLGALPGAVLARRPVLSGHFAGVLMETGDLEGAAARLRDAERWLGERPGSSPAEGPERSPAEGDSPAEMVVVDEDEFRRLPAWIAIYRAALALAHGEVASSEQYARRARELALAEDPLGLGAAAGFLGLAAWRRGDLEAAHSHYAECMAMMQRAGHLSDVIGSAFTLADLRIAQGRLSEARRIYERALQLALEEGAPAPRGAADLYVGLGELDRERNDLEAAAQHLLRSQELGEHLGLIQNRHRWPVAMARLREAQGDPEGALDLLGEAERRFVSSYFPDVRPVGALKARVWVAQGRLGEATGWAREGGLSAEDELSYLREFEHLTLARVLLAQARRDRTGGEMQAATVFLERLLVAAEEGGRTGSVIEILVLQALAHQAQGDLPAALAPLGRALALAEPEGYVRLFVDEGPPAAELLRAAVAAGTLERPGLAAYAGRLLAAFEAESQEETGEAPLPTASPAPPRPGPAAQPAENGLVEPLSLRELDVLRLFETELSGPEIARELRIALSTVRTHTKSIYGKLNVNNRRAAVKRAAELDLI